MGCFWEREREREREHQGFTVVYYSVSTTNVGFIGLMLRNSSKCLKKGDGLNSCGVPLVQLGLQLL